MKQSTQPERLLNPADSRSAVLTGNPPVSVLALTYNGRKYVDACLQAVLDQDFPRDQYEVVVMDNASTDGTADYVAAHYPQVRLVRNERNLGTATALNQAVTLHQHSPYLAYLSQDVVVHRHWLGALVEALQSDPQARLAASNIYFKWWPEFRPDDREAWPERVYVCDLTGYGVLDYYVKPFSPELAPIQVLAADTAACMVERRVLDELGDFLNEDFFMHGEVIDLCLRINSMERKVLFVPRSVAYNASDWQIKFNRRTLLKALRAARNNLLAFFNISYAGEFAALLPRLLLGHAHRGGQHGLSPWRNLAYRLAALPVALAGLAVAVAAIPRSQARRRKALQRRIQPRGWLVRRMRDPGWEPDPGVWLSQATAGTRAPVAPPG